MDRFGWAQASGRIGRGCRQRALSDREQAAGNIMCWNPQRHRIETGADQMRQWAVCRAWHNQCQPAGPEMLGEHLSHAANLRIGLRFCEVFDMNNQRIKGRAFFCGKNRCHRLIICCICAQPIDSFCRKRDKRASAQSGRCSVQVFSFRGQKFSGHGQRKHFWS